MQLKAITFLLIFLYSCNGKIQTKNTINKDEKENRLQLIFESGKFKKGLPYWE